MTWKKTLLKKCDEIKNTGGEVKITFTIRKKYGINVSVPIIRVYPRNQIICDQVNIELDD